MEMERYIGDGVYASFDGYGIMLDLRAQAPTMPITKILLEPNVLQQLNDFDRELRAHFAAQQEEATT